MASFTLAAQTLEIIIAICLFAKIKTQTDENECYKTIEYKNNNKENTIN